MTESTVRVHVALVHFPVVNKQGDLVTSSVTTLDVHDMARICRTYAVEKFYVVTPLEPQQQLVNRIIDHWQTGHGAIYNPSRKEALKNAQVCNRLEDVFRDIESQTGKPPVTVIPDAKRFPQSVTYDEARARLASESGTFLLIFGTAWGLEKGVVQRADMVLAPIDGLNGYNHLPVRAATAIILDRLLGQNPVSPAPEGIK